MDFSVDLLHTVENDMKSEMSKLMKAINVSSPSDISHSTLGKLNKGPLQTVLASMVKLLEKNLGIERISMLEDFSVMTQIAEHFVLD